VNDLFRDERAISRHIFSIADAAREQVKAMISDSLKDGSLTICPDYWTDRYKGISYLAVSITFVNGEYTYQAIDLFCRQFEFDKKNG
jgi:hypothetical protein